MYNHAKENYKCPICLAVSGIENDDTWIVQDDIFYKDDLVTGFIGSKSINGNEFHPLIVPNEHLENIYELPGEISDRIGRLAKLTAIALKELRNCDGITTVQNNEPAGDQHAYHFHLHIIPRFENDNFHEELWRASRSHEDERKLPAKLLKEWFQNFSGAV